MSSYKKLIKEEGQECPYIKIVYDEMDNDDDIVSE